MKNPFYLRDCLSIRHFTPEELTFLIKLARHFKENRAPKLLEGVVMASCFYESSTRTRLSFESAIQRLGGSVIGFSESKGTSADKGESLRDAMRVMEGYADVIVLRHPKEGASAFVASKANTPIINAGDGSNEHPTQTLVDLYTIEEQKGRLKDLSIAFVGDLKYGRTVHSLVEALSHFSPRFFFVSPESLSLPEEVLRQVKDKRVMFSCHRSLEEVLPRVDVIYMTRMQKERFVDLDFERVKELYRLDAELLKKAPKDVKVLHPLPRNDEIATDVDALEAAAYFTQAHNGVYVRQALLYALLSKNIEFTHNKELVHA